MARQVSIISFSRSSVVKRTTGIDPGMMTPLSVLHEFDVKEEVIAKTALELGKLFPARGRDRSRTEDMCNCHRHE